YFDSQNRRRFVVTRVLWKPSDPAWKPFGPGVEIVSWNGTPIDEAVRINTDFEEGSNEPHDFALALQFMTVRWLGASYEPDSPWVEVGYRVRDGQKARDCLFDWSVVVLKRSARLVVTGQAGEAIFGSPLV